MAKTKFDFLIMLFLSLFVGLFTNRKRDEARGHPCLLLACHDTNRYGNIGGKWFSPLLEPIGEYLQRRGMTVMHLCLPPCLDAPKRVYGESFNVNLAFALVLLRKHAERFFVNRALAEERAHQRMVMVYKQQLHAMSPELILGISVPSELAEAAHELKIPLIEAIHGMQLRASDQLVIEKFTAVDTRLPGTFLSFDSMTHAALCELFKSRGITSFHMPHPWHTEAARPCSNLIEDSSRVESLFSSYRAAFLLTLQWGYDGERDDLRGILPNGILHPSLEAVFAASPDILWLIRLHPVQLKGFSYKRHRRYAYALSRRFSNVNVMEASFLPLPLLLRRCSGHVSMLSGVCGEAAAVGVPSLMLCPTLKNGGEFAGMFSELGASMITYGELRADEILEWVMSRAASTAPPSANVPDETLYFEKKVDQMVNGLEGCT